MQLQITPDTTNFDYFWTIVAGLAAFASAIYAFRSNVIANRALKLARQEYKDKQSNFSLYIIDGFRWTEKTRDKRKFLFFNLTIKNKSESSSSFHANLEIEYVKTDHSVARIIVEHNPDFLSAIPKQTLTVFQKDIRVEGKGIESKWLIFEQPTNVFLEYRIEQYTVKIHDTHDNHESAKLILLKELKNETTKE